MKPLIVLVALLIAACAPTTDLATPDSIVIEHDAWARSSAYQQAEAHCQQYGKHAVLISTDGKAWKTSSFRCE